MRHVLIIFEKFGPDVCIENRSPYIVALPMKADVLD